VLNQCLTGDTVSWGQPSPRPQDWAFDVALSGPRALQMWLLLTHQMFRSVALFFFYLHPYCYWLAGDKAGFALGPRYE
jgi:hypothetical protein